MIAARNDFLSTIAALLRLTQSEETSPSWLGVNCCNVAVEKRVYSLLAGQYAICGASLERLYRYAQRGMQTGDPAWKSEAGNMG